MVLTGPKLTEADIAIINKKIGWDMGFWFGAASTLSIVVGFMILGVILKN